MRVLVACEYTATVRDAFLERGHDAWSCDTRPTAGDPQRHYQCDVREVLSQNWDLMIAHPPCTYLTLAGNKHYADSLLRLMAVGFVFDLWNSPIPKVCIENPIGYLSTAWRKPDQYIQPYEYGHPFTKKTCLWLRGLPKLGPTETVQPARGSYAWNSLGIRKSDRDKTFSGWAEAMASQWSEVVVQCVM